MVVLPQWRAQLIAIDLLLYDEVDSLYRLQTKEVRLLKAKIEVKEDLLLNKNLEIQNLKRTLLLADQQSEAKDQIARTWQKAFKRQRRQKYVIAGASAAIIILVVIATL